MELRQLLKGFEYEISCENDIDCENIEINYLTLDSRNVRKNTLFICIDGFKVDGHNFIEEAYKNGAVAFIVSKDLPVPKGAVKIVVKNSRIAMAFISENFYKFDKEKVKLIGITGTNGKTSSSFYMHHILMKANKIAGLIGTVDIKINEEQLKVDFATSTTPDSIELMQILKSMTNKNATNVVMEVTSHALLLHKVENLEFEVSIFTNLTTDHLDLHKTMENYRDAKAKLFEQSKVSVINVDDPYGDFMVSKSKKAFTYSIKKDSDFKASNLQFTNEGVDFNVNIEGENHKFCLPIHGTFSVYNALGVIVSAYILGVDIEVIKDGIKTLKSVPGRIEKIENNLGINVIVDYAHTPDGLYSIISTVLEFTKGRVITVFGCGGDRDKTKRPMMGEISSKYSDITIITSDNPRSENPYDILKDIEKGTQHGEVMLIEDREEAIKTAINLANKTDSVIIAGKGHENYQIFKDITIDFDDSYIAKKIINEIEANL